MKFSIIIPSKDRQEILEQTLKRLNQAVNFYDLEVIIINDAAHELVLRQEFAYIKIYNNSEGRGVASARNLGANKASHDWMIFMDDDMWVQPDTFLKLIPFTDNENRLLNPNWIYPKFLEAQLPYKPFLRYLRNYGFDSLEGWSSDVVWKRDKAFQVNGITSQFLLFHKKAFEKVGGYNITFPFAGFEDHDMSKRLKQCGLAVFVDPQNMIFHNEADRLDVENWLERKRRGAITRRVAVHFQHTDLILQYSFIKCIVYKAAYACRRMFLLFLKNWPSVKQLDPLYFLLINLMLGTYAFKGYTSRQAQDFINDSNTSRN